MKPESCGECKYWVPHVLHSILGECQMELETKTKYDDPCPIGEKDTITFIQSEKGKEEILGEDKNKT